MNLQESILSRAPDYIPDGTISVSEEHTFEEKSGTVKTVYQLDKAPFEEIREVQAQVDGITADLIVGTDVVARDVDDSVGVDSIAFINTDRTPDAGTTFTVEYRVDSVIYRYIQAFDSDVSKVDSKIDTSISSKYIDEAPGDSLDTIGSAFGEIGRRRRRSNSAYRSFLRSIVRAFNATGTIGDIKFAVAAALSGSTEDVSIEENFEKTGFKVSIDIGDSEVLTASLNDLIELAKPSGVELLKPPVINTEEKTVTVVPGSSSVTREPGLGYSTLDSGDKLE